MRLAVKLFIAFGVTSLTVFGSSFSVTLNGPDLSPKELSAPSSFPVLEGACATVSTPGCIITGGGNNNPNAFDPISATITENSPGQWTYSETVNTPNSFSEGAGFGPTAFADALFYDTKTGTYWGLALDTQYDLLGQSGGLYYGGTNYNAAYVFPPVVGGADPVLLNASDAFGIPLASSSNTISGNMTPTTCYSSTNAVISCSLQPSDGYSTYTITDSFTVASGYNFLGTNPDPFEFEVASFICSNGVILANAPEPRGVVFMGAALLLLVGFITKLRTKTA